MICNACEWTKVLSHSGLGSGNGQQYIYIYIIYIYTHTEIVHANATHAVLASLSEDIQDQLPVHRRGSVACPILIIP